MVSGDMITKLKQLVSTVAIALVLSPVAAHAQDEVVYYHTDAIGSVRMVTDATGTVVARYDYLPFGEIWPTSPPNTSPDVRQFVGKERDTDTGLDYSGARYYRAQSGRFTSVDPLMEIGKAQVNPQRWNRYAYAGNNPQRYLDPDGRSFESLWDVFNIGIGIKSLVDNLRQGNFGSAAIDAGGIVLDTGAAAVPLLPGGAAAAIKAARAADASANAAATLRVIGHQSDNYVSIGKSLGAKVFNMKEEVYNSLSAAEKWAANAKFLDRGIKESAIFRSVTRRDQVRPGTALEREIKYLIERGYKWNDAGTQLLRF